MQETPVPQYIATPSDPTRDPCIPPRLSGHGPYHRLQRDAPQHWAAFAEMHTSRRHCGLEVEDHFRRHAQGFAHFLAHMGPIPEAMASPTVGRLDLAQGYVRGNLFWQDPTAHRREAVLSSAKRHAAQRTARLQGLVQESGDLARQGVATLKSTLIARWWFVSGEPCQSGAVPKILRSLANTFPEDFLWEVARLGRGRRATVFRLWVSPALHQDLARCADAVHTV